MGAIHAPNRLARLVWVLGKRCRVNLIQILSPAQVCTLASNIRNACHDLLRQLVLHIEVPLLDVGPPWFCRNDVESQRERQTPADACIASVIGLSGILYEWRSGFERFLVLFIVI